MKSCKRTSRLTERIGLGADSLKTQKTTSVGLQGEGSEDPPVKIQPKNIEGKDLFPYLVLD